MKKIFCFIAGMYVIATHGFVYAQVAMRGQSNQDESYPNVWAENAVQPAEAVTNRNAISIRAVRHLVTSFPQLAEEKWYAVKDGFIAMFIKDAARYKVAYDRKGNWKYTMLHYNESGLPKNVRHMIKRAYYDYAIMYAHEIRLHDNTIYQVEMQDGTRWKVVQVRDHEMREVKKFFKTPDAVKD